MVMQKNVLVDASPPYLREGFGEEKISLFGPKVAKL